MGEPQGTVKSWLPQTLRGAGDHLQGDHSITPSSLGHPSSWVTAVSTFPRLSSQGSRTLLKHLRLVWAVPGVQPPALQVFVTIPTHLSRNTWKWIALVNKKKKQQSCPPTHGQFRPSLTCAQRWGEGPAKGLFKKKKKLQKVSSKYLKVKKTLGWKNCFWRKQKSYTLCSVIRTSRRTGAAVPLRCRTGCAESSHTNATAIQHIPATLLPHLHRHLRLLQHAPWALLLSTGRNSPSREVTVGYRAPCKTFQARCNGQDALHWLPGGCFRS